MLIDWLNTPACGVALAALLAEGRAQLRARQARRERDEFRAEVAELVAHDNEHEE